jgi:hypothetical protein
MLWKCPKWPPSSVVSPLCLTIELQQFNYENQYIYLHIAKQSN